MVDGHVCDTVSVQVDEYTRVLHTTQPLHRFLRLTSPPSCVHSSSIIMAGVFIVAVLYYTLHFSQVTWGARGGVL